MPRSTYTARQLTLLAVLATTLAAAAPGVAGAASPPLTRQALAADAAFLAYAPAPPAGAGALCLVDTGVTANPDTTPGLMSATALDGGTGDDVDPLKHGTIDAAVAGGSGHGGLLGAWPLLKIVSVRSTDVPSPGQEPTFDFNSYWQGILQCDRPRSGPPVFAIDLPLASVIPPSPDQTASLATAVAQATAQGSTVLAAAGNAPGAIQLPASQPGIFAVGAGDTTNGGICSFSASASLTFFAPGCFIDTIDPTSDAPLCCGNGTSQASAFTAGVLVALRSYDPALTAAKAVQLLLSTTTNGHLDVAAAFRADNLGPIVDAGNAAIPKPPPTPAPPSSTTSPPASQPTVTPAPTVPLPLVRSATWRRGVLRIALVGLPIGARLHVKLTFAHRKSRYYATAHTSLHRRTPRPKLALLHLTKGAAVGATVTLKL
jgi:hypothetical protein